MGAGPARVVVSPWRASATATATTATKDTPLSIMMFYGFNETAQCGWTTHAWQELGTGQNFKTNLPVALADVVSFHGKSTHTL